MEYKVLQADSLVSAEQLNDMALDGWRLVQIVKDSGLFYFYLCNMTVN